jgi:hypothetical protein
METQSMTYFACEARTEDSAILLSWTIAGKDMAEIDAIFARHGCATVPPGRLED